MTEKERDSGKHPRLEAHDCDLSAVLHHQKSFVEGQENERKDLEKQLTAKQQEQEQLKEELGKLLEDQKATKICNDELNNQIADLQDKIKIGNSTELELQQKYRELLDKLEQERLIFEDKLAEEKQKWQEMLKQTRQEKEKFEIDMVEQMEEFRERLEKKQQEEWQTKIDSMLYDEKSVQSKLQDEKLLLEQKLKEMEETLKKKEEAQQLQQQQLQQQQLKQQQLQQQQKEMEEVLKKKEEEQRLQQQQQMQQQQQLLLHQRNTASTGAAQSADVTQSFILVEVNNQGQITPLPILETIDLTGGTENTSSSTRNVEDHAVINKVNNIMDEQLTCSICSELFIRAMTLNCMHTFCRYCIDSWIKRRRDCPNCRSPIASMTRSLVVDNFIEKMLESLTPEQMQKRKQLIEERKPITSVIIKKKILKKR